MSLPFFRYNSPHEPSPKSSSGTPSPSASPPPVPPFTIYIAHLPTKQPTNWQPAAFVALNSNLRTSGLLRELPPEDLKTLIILLSFVTPNGHCAATLHQLTEALRLSAAKTRARLNRLVELHWLGQPIVMAYRAANGMESFGLVPGFAPIQEEAIKPPVAQTIKAVPRQVIIERSRRVYARTREEVEREIARLNNWKTPDELAQEKEKRQSASPGEILTTTPATSVSITETPETAALRRDLLNVGLIPEQIENVLAHFPQERIERQLMWLPYREEVRNRAGFLLAALKNDYAQPLSFHPLLAEPKEEPIQDSSDEAQS